MMEIFFGVLGPLLVASATGVMAERTYRRHPERLTGLMIKAFAGKMVFFGAYVAAMVGLLSMRAMPFVISFTTSFVVLHLTEALYLRRLFGR